MRIGIYLGYRFKVNLDGVGVGRYIARLAEGLLRERKETTVHILGMTPNIAEIEQVFKRLKADFSLRVTVYCADDLDWVNANVPVDLWIIPAVIIDSAQYLTKPLIACLHDVAYIHFPELAELGQRVDGLVREITHKAAAVICNSNYIRIYDGINYLRLPEEKTHVIRPAAPVEEYAGAELRSEQDMRQCYQLDRSYFVFPSNMWPPHKNHLRLVEAFLRFRHTQATGDTGPDLVFTDVFANFYYKEEFAQIVSTYDPALLAGIKFLGKVPSQDVPALYKYAAGTVVPTLFEGSCPFPILESLLVGTPVAFGRIAVAMEIISDPGAFITFDPFDLPDMQKALAKLWESGPGTAETQKAALHGFLERTWQDVAREYYQVIARIIW